MSRIDHTRDGGRGRWSQRTRHAILLAAATLASAGIAGAGTAAAASTTPDAPGPLQVKTQTPSNKFARFTAPASGALVTSDVVPVHIQAASSVASVRVWVGSENVSGRFSKHGDAFTARLPHRSSRSARIASWRRRCRADRSAARPRVVRPRQAHTAPDQRGGAAGDHAGLLGAARSARPAPRTRGATCR